ncbi:hypothetical protein DFH09DRAFT_1219251 [Mycena vulgaris]|nr:hypothetical protein DFH09DRAFT_1219251 [Mycena vulgaris]
MLLETSPGGLEGHLSPDCTAETKPKSCCKCGTEGHIGHSSRDCPSRRSALAIRAGAKGALLALSFLVLCGPFFHLFGPASAGSSPGRRSGRG